MNSQERNEILAQLNTMGQALNALRIHVLRSCESCEHWEGTCTKWNAMPPAEVIEVGCPEWLEQIPF